MKKTWGFWISLVWLTLLVLVAWLLPTLTPGDPYQPVADPLLPPAAYPPLGTDALGRDFMSRLVYGSRITLSAGLLAATITILSGLVLGLTASFSGGWLDRLIFGAVNAALAIPGLLFALLLTASMGPGFGTVILAIGMGLIPGYIRLTRTVFKQVMLAEYIAAAHSMGAKNVRIVLQHLLPNALRGVASVSALHFSWAIMGITTLTFLGLGGDPSIPEWGIMLDSGRQYLQIAPRLALIPGFLISATILAVFRLSEDLV
jgi:peptide/nickel transport system permease protein